MQHTLFLAHRGFSGRYPENSPLAFRMVAEETHADGIETDVQLTRDGVMVLFHDDRVDRTSNGSGRICDMTYEELLKLDIGSWKGPEFAGEHVWTLEQLLDFCQETHLLLNVELKNGNTPYPGLEGRVANLIRARRMQEQVFVSSFNHPSMQRFHQICPEVETGLLYSEPLAETLTYRKLTGTDNLHPQYTVLQFQPHLPARLHANGGRIHVWTVNEVLDMREMLRLNVDSIITNFPDRRELALRSAVLETIPDAPCV